MFGSHSMKDKDDLKRRITRLESLFEVTSRALVRSKYRALDRLDEQTPATRMLTCLICEYQAAQQTFATRVSECQFGGGRLERYACPQCGALFGPMKMLDITPDDLTDEYRLLYATYAEADPTERELRTFASMSPVRGGTYLNWGCGISSNTVAVLRGRGWDVWGYEPTALSTENHIICRRAEIQATFDGIFSNNVIEHFTEPVAQFRDFASMLKPGGVMAHTTPCYEYLYHNTRFHTIFYLEDSIRVLADKTGFEIVDRQVDGDYINVLFRKTATQ